MLTLDDHLRIAEQLYITEQQHRNLVADFHKKKCAARRSNQIKFKPNSAQDVNVYKKRVRPYDNNIFGIVKCTMDSLVYHTYTADAFAAFAQTHPRVEGRGDVYFFIRKRVQAEDVQVTLQTFSPEPTLTQTDLDIIAWHNHGKLALVEECLKHMLAGTATHTYIKQIKTWITRLKIQLNK